ncbi:ornithine carbamoyltransferase [Microlunatus phosphovorus NM-1]|uniref:Ornithine carbamoyltransferase n=1 Tax=Microlunatus phosphovorus (strain ATCC 700054 / DSM 10555 / JCM 9379 / NBRC 101784 / NCIMB 13414 / VKM Ac-1990 / NM-1) TaxID=1032480 RepID=F5XS58_MICPN|nr:ornithine carbamoyltransferase [Microlunatus phosphovorus]BAK34739.1 ornithine carbamoyltransferase [Microlunatus phosphovorus NM-1]
MRHFLADDDLSPDEQAQILAIAAKLKEDPYALKPLAGPRCVAVMFDKPTLRTQSSFAAGIAELGGYPMIVDGRLAGIGERESVADVARVLGRQSVAIVWRTFAQSRLEEMAEFSRVPTINALTDSYHPCQILADLLTIQERLGRLAGVSFAYLGDGANNMAHSYLLGCATAGMHVRIGAPAGFHPDPEVIARAGVIAARTGGSVTVTESIAEAVTGCQAVATDTWVSMGQQSSGRESVFVPYGVTTELMSHADPEAIFLHCLPAYRGKEVAAEVIDGPQSVVWDEAENRRHVQKAVLVFLDAAARGVEVEW